MIHTLYGAIKFPAVVYNKNFDPLLITPLLTFDLRTHETKLFK